MFIKSQAFVQRVQNMTDGSIRLTIDLITPNDAQAAEDAKTALLLRNEDTTLVLGLTEELESE